MREAIKSVGLLLYDAFNKFDYDKNGFLSPPEVWGAFDYLNVDMTAQDILHFVSAADEDRDGNISFTEFVDILESESGDSFIPPSREQSVRSPTSPIPLQRQASLTVVKPKGEEELNSLRQSILREEEEDERLDNKLEEEDDLRILNEMEVILLTIAILVMVIIGYLYRLRQI